jgi:hypothetical protein
MTRTPELTTVLADTHPLFYRADGQRTERLVLWEIRPQEIVISPPVGAPLHRTMLGFIPTQDGMAVYELEGTVEIEPLPDQMDDTIRLRVDPSCVKRLNRRQYPRARFDETIEVTVERADGFRASGRLFDLSAGGLRVETDGPFVAGEHCRFLFEIGLDDETHLFEMNAHVVRTTPSEYGFFVQARFDREEIETDARADQTVDLVRVVNRLLVRKTRVS